jgi:sugar (pentulose or hexulose) kinase
MTHRGYVGIDLGTQGLSVIFTDESLAILATGEGGYEMVPGLAAECYEQRPADWEAALQAAMADLRQQLADKGIEMEVLAVGLCGQMHGEVLCDEAGEVVAPARLWCDGRNEAEGHELTEALGVKCPKRMTGTRWLWTVRNRPEIAALVAHITTPSGWLAWRLTGSWNLGVGDASGMFPIDQATGGYDAARLATYDTLTTGCGRSLASLLPVVRSVGEDGGTLNQQGAALLGLPENTPVAPAEGDQPAALAGSLIAEPGMVAMSFGTSVVANAVGDKPFTGVSQAIDHFCAPDGRPINMVWIRNGTTAMNTMVEMLGGPQGFDAVMPQVVDAADDCGGLAALPFMDDEPGVGVSHGGIALVAGLNPDNASAGNTAKAMLLATMFNLRVGCDELDQQGFPRTEILLSGGLVKTAALGQVLADVFNTPVTVLDGADEGTAYGAALMAKYRQARLTGQSISWSEHLAAHATGTPQRFTPQPEAVATLASGYRRHRRLLAIVPQLEQALRGDAEPA